MTANDYFRDVDNSKRHTPPIDFEILYSAGSSKVGLCVHTDPPWLLNICCFFLRSQKAFCNESFRISFTSYLGIEDRAHYNFSHATDVPGNKLTYDHVSH